MKIKQNFEWLYKDSESNISFTWFHRGLGLVYLSAMLPLFFQIKPLIGNAGILPANQLIQKSRELQGFFNTFIQFPSLFFIYPTDFTLIAILLLGCIGAFMLFFRRSLFVGALLSWISFVSITTIGGDFFIIIIDLFLAEVGFLALFSTYHLQFHNQIPNIVNFSLRLLNFRLWFCMGINKFYLPLDVWSDFTFFDYFFQAQPMPTPIAKLFHQSPVFLKYAAEAFLFIGEVIVPFFVFGSKRFRYLSFITFFIISLLIQINGNYGYFNILSVVLAFTILKSKDISWSKNMTNPVSSISASRFRILHVFLIFQIILQLFYCIYIFNPAPYSMQNQFNYLFTNKRPENKILDAIVTPIRWMGYWRICNPYGVFKGIPKYHSELKFSGSVDGDHWKEYEFKYLPSAKTNYLGFYAPYYPRIDHLLFYETLSEGTYKHNPLNHITSTFDPWICTLIKKLMENDSETTKLLKRNPFENKMTPNYIRVEAIRLELGGIGDPNWQATSTGIQKIYNKDSFICHETVLTYEEAMSVVF